jgi:drug/metabolite transporter (DMT)-like permease
MSRDLRLNSHTLLGLLAILLWSSTVALGRRISEQLGPLTAGAAVYLTATVFLAALNWARERSFRKLGQLPRRYVLGCGALFVIYTLALFLALGRAADRSQTMEVGLLNYLWPALTILFSLWLLGNHASLGLIPGTLLALSGVVLVLTQGSAFSWHSFVANILRNPVAYGLGVVAAVSWGLYSNLARRWGTAESEGAVLLFTLATGIAFALLRVFRAEAGVINPRVVVEVAFLGSATALGYLFWDIAMRKGNQMLVAACSYLTPFFSTVVSTLYLHVAPAVSLWLGCALIIAGSVLSWRSVHAMESRKG